MIPVLLFGVTTGAIFPSPLSAGSAHPHVFLAQALATRTTAELLTTPGETSALVVSATGVQIYQCRVGADGKLAWAFKEPRAELSVAGKVVGRHYAGPTWEHGDGSLIKGKPIERADAPIANAIPWLKLTGVEGKGNGALVGITTILRTNTVGGTLSGACTIADEIKEQPYTSDYVFLRN
jgi:hypothetical protein